ncbi:MAG: FMN-binding protein, partial [Eubacteriales bacterium]
MKNSVKSVLTLSIICIVIAALLSAVNFITAPIIEKNDNNKANEALLIVMPNGEGFEEIDISSFTLPSTITAAYKEKNGGYVFKMTTSGYSAGLVVMCGVGSDGKITGATCLSSGETLGEEKTYGEKFLGASSETVDKIDTVSGATKTTTAYRGAIKDALNSFIIVNGGSVDIRTDEEILLDNLKAALPASDGKFTKWFMTELLEGVSAVYVSDDGAGYVFVIGESFIGVGSDGNVVSETDEATKAIVLSSYEKVKASSYTEIDLSSYSGISDKVIKAYKTESGNFIFDLRASGFGINGDEEYGISNEYIYIKVCATADGKIISCVTTEQHETEG